MQLIRWLHHLAMCHWLVLARPLFRLRMKASLISIVPVTSSEIIGEIKPNLNGWTSERLEWSKPELMQQKRKLEPSGQWNFLQGNSKVQARLIGGCMEVLEFLKGTDYWPSLDT